MVDLGLRGSGAGVRGVLSGARVRGVVLGFRCGGVWALLCWAHLQRLMVRVESVGSGFWGSGFRGEGGGWRMKGGGCAAQGVECRVLSVECRV